MDYDAEQFVIIYQRRNPSLERLKNAVSSDGGAPVILRFKIRDQDGKIHIVRCVLDGFHLFPHVDRTMLHISGRLEDKPSSRFWGLYDHASKRREGTMWISTGRPMQAHQTAAAANLPA